MKSRLFPKTRSWFALGAPLESLSPLSVLRIVYALVLLAWPVTASVVGATTTNLIAVAAVEVVTLVVWIVMLRIRNIGLRTCRFFMALVALEIVVLVASGASTLASFAYMLLLILIAIAPALFLSLRTVLGQQLMVAGALWAATATRWGVGRSAVIVVLEFVGGLTVSLTIILLARTVQHRGVDPDTGLPNGFGLADRSAGRHEGEAFVVASVFVKGLADAREALGYHVGTELLRRAVENLGQVLPADSEVGRVEADELVVIADVGDTADPSRAAADTRAESFAATLRQAITAGRYLVDDIEVSLRANVGLAVAPWDGTDVPELIRRATLSARQAAPRPSACDLVGGRGCSDRQRPGPFGPTPSGLRKRRAVARLSTSSGDAVHADRVHRGPPTLEQQDARFRATRQVRPIGRTHGAHRQADRVGPR